MPQLIKSAAVQITRDAMTILPRTVGRHELPVLHAVFGEDNVQEIGEGDGPVEIEPENEVARLSARYGEGAVEKAFGASPKSAIAKLLAEHVQAAGSAPEGDALDAMTKAQLLDEAEARGVAATAAMAKADILAAIRAAEVQ